MSVSVGIRFGLTRLPAGGHDYEGEEGAQTVLFRAGELAIKAAVYSHLGGYAGW